MNTGKNSTGTTSSSGPEAGLFRNRGFMLLWAAYGVSAMGDHISEMALLKTQDALEAPNLVQLQAMITFMFMLPFFVLGPLNGMLADRLPRRGVMIFADLIRALLMFNFSFLIARFEGFGHTWAFMPLLIVGVFAALFSPARAAMLPTLIRQDQLVRANAMSSGLGVIATMIAVLIGGYLADHYPASYSFHIDAGTFIVSAILLFRIRVPRDEVKRPPAEIGVAALTEAVRYVRHHHRVAQLILVAVIVWSCGAVVRSAIPAIVRDVFDRREYIEISGFQARLGFGMLAGALILTALGDALRSEIAITWSLAGIGTAIGILALSVFGHTWPQGSPWISANVAYHLGGLAIILAGIFAAGVMTSYSALMQRIVPNRIRGRVFGLTDLATMAGLLLATGLLGIPHWPNIDRWVGWIMAAVAIMVLATAAGSLWIRLHDRAFSPGVTFWWNFTEFYCRWWFRLKREGICTVPIEGPVIVVANHTSAIDPLLLIVSTPHRKLGFMIAEEYANIPLGGRLIRMMECISVRRNGQDTAATKMALRYLKAGKPLGIFIEGRIPRPGETVEPKEGAAMLALHTGATVIPAHISGTRYSDSVSRAFFSRHRARVRFGKPIDLSAWLGHKLDKQTLHDVSHLLMRHIRDLAGNEQE